MKLIDRVGYRLGSAFGNFARGRVEALETESMAAKGSLLRATNFGGSPIPDLGFAYKQQDLYQRLTWVAVAVSAVAEQAAGKRFNVKQMEGEVERDIPNHEYEILHEQPNELWTGYEFWRALFSFRILTGNGYAWMNRADENSKPEEMWVIPSHQIKPIPDGMMGVRGYWYYPNGSGDESNRQPLQPWEVLHLRSFNPVNKYVGLSAISQVAIVAEGDLAMQKYNRNYFSRDGGRAPGVLAFADPIADPEWEAINADVKKADKEQRMLMLRNVGKGGVEYVTLAMTRKDMEFLAGRASNKTEIYEWIAPGLVSWLSEGATEANSRSGRDAFYELSVWPKLQEAAAKITKDLLPAYGENLKGDYEGVRPKDVQKILQEQAAYERSHTLDEVRAKYYQDKPIGDERGDLIARAASGAPAGIEGLEEPVAEFGRQISAGKSADLGTGKGKLDFRIENGEVKPAMPAATQAQKQRLLLEFAAQTPAKQAEVEKFRTFVKRRQAEMKPEKIGEFEFLELDAAEQTALKAEVLKGDWAVKARLQQLIEEVRTSDV